MFDTHAMGPDTECVRGVQYSLIFAACACGRLSFEPTALLTANDGAVGAPQLVYPQNRIVAVVGQTAVDVAPVADAGLQFTITPALPAGLAVDGANGRISGIATASTETTYVVTATGAGGTAQASLEITALPGFEVDTTSDAPDVLDDGICATAAGTCSLRAAVQSSPQLVLLAPGTYPLGSTLTVASDVMIAGQGAQLTTIRAATLNGLYPAITVATAATVRLRDLAIDDFGGDNGGALRFTAGRLDVDRCSFSNNRSPSSGGVLFINSGAQAYFAHSTFTGNASLGGNGGGWGGVIDGEGASTRIEVTRSTATGNTTAWGSFAHITTGTTLRLENSTLYGNLSTIAGTLASPGGTYTLVNSTIVGNTNTNSTVDSAGVYLYQVPAHYTLTNTIVAFNRDSTGAERNCNRRDLGTSLTSGGGNIFGDTAQNCASYFTAAGDRLSTNPGIEAGAPSDHGGESATILLSPLSPALGNGQPGCPASDQRDLQRGSPCDSGAVEMP